MHLDKAFDTVDKNGNGYSEMDGSTIIRSTGVHMIEAMYENTKGRVVVPGMSNEQWRIQS